MVSPERNVTERFVVNPLPLGMGYHSMKRTGMMRARLNDREFTLEKKDKIMIGLLAH